MTDDVVEISLVVPFFNERATIRPLYDRIVQALAAADQQGWELILVDDGSTDGSLAEARRLVEADPRVTVVQLRGNFGKSAALAAGFEQARGKVVLTLDADLQDDPAEIPRFLAKLAEGYDLVSGWKRRRRDPWPRVLASRIFNLVVRGTTGVRLHDVNCGFKAYRREVLDEINVYGELHRFLPVLAQWRRFRIAEIEVAHAPRRFGRSKYGVSRMFRGLVDLLTVTFLMRYHKKPSHFFAKLGLAFGLAGFVICCFMTVRWFQGYKIGDRPLLSLGILLLVVGVQFFATGLIAELLTHIAARREHEYSIANVFTARRAPTQPVRADNTP
ncbi:MAG: glycosyltransferase family 2 protein [Phycisphaerae bacterium]